MFEMLERLLGRLRNVWDGMTLNQKVISGGVLAASLIAALYISTLSDKMLNYTVLFAQLDAQSASQITASLEQDNISYRLTQGGTAIEVPVGDADKLKIDFIAEGLPESGIVGYEILDTTNFGMSDFLQKVNYKRALEGELSRTLRAIDEIKNAHVLLVIPEPSLFAETANPPTASVVLTLKSNRTLPKSKVEAIANLVASAAVEGLDPRDVTILDNRGVQLSEPVKDDLAMESGTIMELKFSYEQRLADGVKSMIDGAFGAGIALVVVNADLDFDRIERMTTAYDQSTSAIASENRREVTNPTADGGGEEESTTNYETGSIIETLIRTPGSNVRRLSVSVMIDGRETQSVNEDGETVVEKVPWSAAELASIRAISETAVGYDVDRGDRIEVVHMDFDAREYEAAVGGLTIGAAITESIGAVATGVTIIVALGVLYFIVKNIVNTLDPEKIKMKSDKQFRKEILSFEIEEEEIVPSERAEIIRKIVSRAAAEPEMTAKTIKSIYRES